MPFDLHPLTPPSTTTPDPHALYRERRERAAARAPEMVDAFYMGNWLCDTTACFIGWLAIFKHDGWRVGRGKEPERAGSWNKYTIYTKSVVQAADYFGITAEHSFLCFGGTSTTAAFHNRSTIADVRPEDVAATLLRLPYVVGATTESEMRRYPHQ